MSPSAILRGPQVCAGAGVTYRQLDYWDRTGVLHPSVAPARGSGSQRLYSTEDAWICRVLGYLSAHGATGRVLAAVTRTLRADPDAWEGVLMVTGDGQVTSTFTPAAAMASEGLAACWLVNPAAVIEDGG